MRRSHWLAPANDVIVRSRMAWPLFWLWVSCDPVQCDLDYWHFNHLFKPVRPLADAPAAAAHFEARHVCYCLEQLCQTVNQSDTKLPPVLIDFNRAFSRLSHKDKEGEQIDYRWAWNVYPKWTISVPFSVPGPNDKLTQPLFGRPLADSGASPCPWTPKYPPNWVAGKQIWPFCIVDNLIPRATEFEPNSGQIPGFTHNRNPPLPEFRESSFLAEQSSLFSQNFYYFLHGVDELSIMNVANLFSKVKEKSKCLQNLW